jgi:hypothetical protein
MRDVAFLPRWVRELYCQTTYDRDKYTSNTPIHTALDVRNLNDEINRASAKSYTDASGNTTTDHRSTRKLRHPHALLLHQTKADIALRKRLQTQEIYEWRTSAAVAPYNRSNTRMDTPHLRSQGTPSDRCFYPHIIIQLSRLLGLLHPFALVFARLTRPWKWRRYVLPKRRLTFNGLHGVIS